MKNISYYVRDTLKRLGWNGAPRNGLAVGLDSMVAAARFYRNSVVAALRKEYVPRDYFYSAVLVPGKLISSQTNPKTIKKINWFGPLAPPDNHQPENAPQHPILQGFTAKCARAKKFLKIAAFLIDYAILFMNEIGVGEEDWKSSMLVPLIVWR